MNYPLISEYIEAIKSAKDNFKELNYLRPVLDDDGLPIMTSGNLALVFKMIDEREEKLYAIKCFTKEQKGRAKAYRMITEELKDVESSYLVSIHFFDKELFVDTEQTTETEFPVLQMDWVEGKTLDKYLRVNLDDKFALEMLFYRFSQLAQWLISQPFAHGDLKPDNILIRENCSLVLVDYDGMYVPAMKGQKARELGSPDFRHPQHTENDFNEYIDTFPIASILLSLKAICTNPQLLIKKGSPERLLFSNKDYWDIDKSGIFQEIYSFSKYKEKKLCKLFSKSCKDYNLLPNLNNYLSIYFKRDNYKKKTFYILFFILFLLFVFMYVILKKDILLWFLIYLIITFIGIKSAYIGSKIGGYGCGCFVLLLFIYYGAKIATRIVNILFE